MDILTLLFTLYLTKTPHTDYLFLGKLTTYEVASRTFDIPAGLTNIEVIVPNDYHINCQYSNKKGAVGYYANNVTHCQANTNFFEPIQLIITVENKEKRDIEYRVHISN